MASRIAPILRRHCVPVTGRFSVARSKPRESIGAKARQPEVRPERRPPKAIPRLCPPPFGFAWITLFARRIAPTGPLRGRIGVDRRPPGHRAAVNSAPNVLSRRRTEFARKFSSEAVGDSLAASASVGLPVSDGLDRVIPGVRRAKIDKRSVVPAPAGARAPRRAESIDRRPLGRRPDERARRRGSPTASRAGDARRAG